jgi:hypothetical protein
MVKIIALVFILLTFGFKSHTTLKENLPQIQTEITLTNVISKYINLSNESYIFVETLSNPHQLYKSIKSCIKNSPCTLTKKFPMKFKHPTNIKSFVLYIHYTCSLTLPYIIFPTIDEPYMYVNKKIVITEENSKFYLEC